MRNIYTKLSTPVIFALFLFSLNSYSQPVIGFQSVITGLSNPVDVVNAGDSKLYIAQQNGLIRIWNGTSLSTFLDISSVITPSAGGEPGLLSLAFHPSYSTNGYLFVWYTNNTGAVTLARYKRNATDVNKADLASGQVLLSITKPGSPYFKNHNGGKLNFGPDGYLYVGTGDGGDGGDPFNNAQNGASFLGKMLRLDVNSFATAAPFYNIPATNPYQVTADGIADEIFDFGLRNPWRWSFDRSTGDMWIGDVGQGAWEEVNYISAGTASGLNFGWNCREGLHAYGAACAGSFTDPIFEYNHTNATGGFAITGGYVYRGPDQPSLTGYYVTADYVSGNIWIMKPNGLGGAISNLQTGSAVGNIASFGEGADGTLYAIQRPTGTIYKVIVTNVLPVTFSDVAVNHFSDYNDIHWTTATEVNTKKFNVEYSTDNLHFFVIAEVAASGNSNGSVYTYHHVISSVSKGYYRIAAVDNNAATKYSSIVAVSANSKEIKIYPTLLATKELKLDLPFLVNKLQIIGMDGRVVYEKDLRNTLGTISF
ncbi:MAG: PQQ-dependent sugar dehydrogenase, partial [Ferruginibacter sp.]